MSLLTRPLTYADVQALPPDGNRYEVIDEELVVSAAPNKKHQRWSYLLIRMVGDVVDDGQLGEVYHAPVDVRLFPDRDTPILQPDLLFIRRDRLHIYGPNLVEGAPDLVVEILSASTRALDLTRKAQLYAEAGVAEYWVADPDEPSLRIYALRGGRYEEIPAEGGRVVSAVVPGLVVELGTLFDVLG
jgi:Uma2 family endonuclease